MKLSKFPIIYCDSGACVLVWLFVLVVCRLFDVECCDAWFRVAPLEYAWRAVSTLVLVHTASRRVGRVAEYVTALPAGRRGLARRWVSIQ